MDCCGLSGESLVLLGALAAIQLAQGKCEEELGVLAAFFTVLGDNLALLALCAPSGEDCEKPGEATGSDTPAAPVFAP